MQFYLSDKVEMNKRLLRMQMPCKWGELVHSGLMAGLR